MSSFISRDDESPNDKDWQKRHHNSCDPGYSITNSPVYIASHESTVVAQQNHQHKNEWEEHATNYIRQIEHEDQAIFWHKQGDTSAYDNDEGIEP